MFVCNDCLERCGKTFYPAAPGTGVEAWEVSPCLMHTDPHDGEQFVETYETFDEARDAEYGGTGSVFWGVYAVMRPEYHSDVITPTMHLVDFDSPKSAAEFVRAMGGTNRRPE